MSVVRTFYTSLVLMLVPVYAAAEDAGATVDASHYTDAGHDSGRLDAMTSASGVVSGYVIQNDLSMAPVFAATSLSTTPAPSALAVDVSPVEQFIAAITVHDWQIVAMFGCMLIAWFSRYALPSTHFAHTNGGVALVTTLSAIVGAMIPMFQAHAWNTSTFFGILFGAIQNTVTTLFAMSNPTMISLKREFDTPASKTDSPRNGAGLATVAFLVIFGAALSACAFFHGISGGDKTAVDVGGCALNQLPGVVTDAVPNTIAAANGTKADWTSELTALEGRGIAFALCTVKASFSDVHFNSPLFSAGHGDGGVDERHRTAAQRMADYINAPHRLDGGVSDAGGLDASRDAGR